MSAGSELSLIEVVLFAWVVATVVVKSGRLLRDSDLLSFLALSPLGLTGRDWTELMVVVVLLLARLVALLESVVTLLWLSSGSLESMRSSSLKAMSRRRELEDSSRLAVSGLSLEREVVGSSRSAATMAVLRELEERFTTMLDLDLALTVRLSEN